MPASVRISPPAVTPALAAVAKTNRKRRNSEISSEGSQLSSSQSRAAKKARVSFDEDVEVRFVDDFGEKSSALIQQEIRSALRQHADGDRDGYLDIKSIFSVDTDSEEPSSDNKLRKYLVGLAQSTTLLNKRCSDLVYAVLDYPWLARSDRTVLAYTRFLGNLVSSQSHYISHTLRMLVENFSHISRSAGPSSSYQDLTRTQLHDRIHQALKYILNLVPSSSGVLATIITSSFPAPDESRRAHVDYVRNLLRLTEYAREVKGDILDLVTERLMKIDVQVQIDVEDIADEAEEALVEGTVDSAQRLEDDEEDSDNESVSSDESIDPEEERINALRGAVQKMDAMMDQLFGYYTPVFQKGNPIEAHRIFDQLLSQFSKTVLPTYRSRHTQFLLFHFAQASPDLLSAFIEACLKILKDKARSNVIRQTVAAYIASFVARGSNVKSETVIYVFDSLAGFMDKLRRENEPGCRGPDLHRYNAYYAANQALIYIFCFRWRDLLQDPEDYEDLDHDFDIGELVWAHGVKEAFQQNFMSKLNPLKVCAPEIVDEFARIAHHLQFLYIYPILDTNKSIRLGLTSTVTSTSSLHGERYHQLDAYFPFDPYNLPLSKRWLVNDYNEWKGIPGLHDEPPHFDHHSTDDECEEGVGAEAEDDDGTETPDDED